jgi:hypothetical protein
MQPRETALSRVARQNRDPMASWLVTGCGQAVQARSAMGSGPTVPGTMVVVLLTEVGMAVLA